MKFVQSFGSRKRVKKVFGDNSSSCIRTRINLTRSIPFHDFQISDQNNFRESIEMESKFDQQADFILNYFRSSSYYDRLLLLEQNSLINDFLTFYSISPSHNLFQAGNLNQDALSFFVCHCAENELHQIFI